MVKITSRLAPHPEVGILVEEKFIGGGEIGNSFLQLGNFAPQLVILILDLKKEKR